MAVLDRLSVVHHRLAFLQRDVRLLPIRAASFLTAALLHLALVLNRANARDLDVEDLFHGLLDVLLSRRLLDTECKHLSGFASAVLVGGILFQDDALLGHYRRFQNVPNGKLTHSPSPPSS